jgi:glutamate synthase (NADPH/NADH) small chain
VKKAYRAIPRQIQTKRSAEVRSFDFDPTYIEFNGVEAQIQGNRCLQCPIDLLRGLASEFNFCRSGCPLGNQIPRWINMVRNGDIENAFIESNAVSPFPEILGRICPHDSLCQGFCTIAKTEHGSVTIGAIEIFLNEEAFRQGLLPYYGEDLPKSGKKVAVIGSGPASFSCATFLMRAGVEVTIFEKLDVLGGLLVNGIPNFKIDRNAIARRFAWMQKAGLKTEMNCDVDNGKMAEILREFDAVFAGVGAPVGRGARMENENADGVYRVMEILTKCRWGAIHHEDNPLEGKDIVVIGGGDSAMDGLRTSLRSNARSATCVYRRDETNMPGSKKEVINAREEGGVFNFYSSPKEIITDENNKVKGIICQRTELGEPDQGGRQRVQIIEGSEFEIKCDIIILALGFDNKKFPWYETANIKSGKWGEITVNEEQRTSNPKIFAGGDGARGASLAVNATVDGKKAAHAMAKDFDLKVHRTS